jgi:hypothetical protein
METPYNPAKCRAERNTFSMLLPQQCRNQILLPVGGCNYDNSLLSFKPIHLKAQTQLLVNMATTWTQFQQLDVC